MFRWPYILPSERDNPTGLFPERPNPSFLTAVPVANPSSTPLPISSDASTYTESWTGSVSGNTSCTSSQVWHVIITFNTVFSANDMHHHAQVQRDTQVSELVHRISLYDPIPLHTHAPLYIPTPLRHPPPIYRSQPTRESDSFLESTIAASFEYPTGLITPPDNHYRPSVIPSVAPCDDNTVTLQYAIPPSTFVDSRIQPTTSGHETHAQAMSTAVASSASSTSSLSVSVDEDTLFLSDTGPVSTSTTTPDMTWSTSIPTIDRVASRQSSSAFTTVPTSPHNAESDPSPDPPSEHVIPRPGHHPIRRNALSPATLADFFPSSSRTSTVTGPGTSASAGDSTAAVSRPASDPHVYGRRAQQQQQQQQKRTRKTAHTLCVCTMCHKDIRKADRVSHCLGHMGLKEWRCEW